MAGAEAANGSQSRTGAGLRLINPAHFPSRPAFLHEGSKQASKQPFTRQRTSSHFHRCSSDLRMAALECVLAPRAHRVSLPGCPYIHLFVSRTCTVLLCCAVPPSSARRPYIRTVSVPLTGFDARPFLPYHPGRHRQHHSEPFAVQQSSDSSDSTHSLTAAAPAQQHARQAACRPASRVSETASTPREVSAHCRCSYTLPRTWDSSAAKGDRPPAVRPARRACLAACHPKPNSLVCPLPRLPQPPNQTLPNPAKASTTLLPSPTAASWSHLPPPPPVLKARATPSSNSFDMQVHPSSDHFYHAHPPSQSAPGYSNGIGQPEKQDPIHYRADSHNSSPNMYPYQQHPQQPQAPQQQQHQHHQHPSYPGMQASVPPPRMPPPGQPGMLPPLHTGMPAPTLPNLPGAQSMPPGMPPQQPMYGGPPSAVGQPIKTEPKQMSFSGVKGDYRYTLQVDQQPQRARMCGFGDKDRRPITPPPCVRLIITHKDTGQEISPDDTAGSFFVLQVDLWDKDATREVNIVRASSSSPAVSISTATTTSYPPPQERTMVNQFGHPMPVYYSPETGQQYYDPNHGQPGYPQSMYMPQYQPQVVQPQSNAMYTRNLIGSLTVNASILEDLDKKPGYWFVLQDLSVRTEGWFR